MLEILTLKIAVVSFMWIVILSHEDCCNWWFRFGLRFEKYWFHKPIWGCELCFSGQVALWTYFIIHTKGTFSHFKPYFYLQAYNLPEHIYFVCITIFFTLLITKTYTKILK